MARPICDLNTAASSFAGTFDSEQQRSATRSGGFVGCHTLTNAAMTVVSPRRFPASMVLQTSINDHVLAPPCLDRPHCRGASSRVRASDLRRGRQCRRSVAVHVPGLIHFRSAFDQQARQPPYDLPRRCESGVPNCLPHWDQPRFHSNSIILDRPGLRAQSTRCGRLRK